MSLLNLLIQLKVLSQKEKLIIQFLIERMNQTQLDVLTSQNDVSLFFTLICYENALGKVRLEWSQANFKKILTGIVEEFEATKEIQKYEFTIDDIRAQEKSVMSLIDSDIQKQLGKDLDELQFDLNRLAFGKTSQLICRVTQDDKTFYYFQKNYHAEIDILQGIDSLLSRKLESQDANETKDLSALKEVFAEPFILPKDEETKEHYLFHERQVVAAYLASQSTFFIISGGPGTGKTSVLVQVLRTLTRIQPDLDMKDIALCAPTGRAKARMGESLVNSLGPLVEHTKKPGYVSRPDIEKDITLSKCQSNSFTLHSLLRNQLKGSEEKLNYKLIVIDEFSMVDVHLFALLIKSLPDDCRLILLGDMHQLPPVGHGSVLGDLSKSFTQTKATLSVDLYAEIKSLTTDIQMDNSEHGYGMTSQKNHKLLNKIVVLTKSQRSAEYILQLAKAANDGDFDQAKALLTDTSLSQGQVVYINPKDKEVNPSVKEFLKSHMTDKWKKSLNSISSFVPDELPSPEITSQSHSKLHQALNQVFEAHHNMRILCLGHHGLRGTVSLNTLAREILSPKVKDPTRRIHGELVMVTRNQNDIRLYNGDAGIVLIVNKHKYIVFPVEKTYRVEPLERIHYVESAFAISVHKSQGSEYREIIMVLPENKTKLLNREILYTGITRAKKIVNLYGDAELFAEGVKRFVDRPSALSEWLES